MTSDDDARAISLILEAGLDAEIWGFSRAVRADVEALVELGLRASVIESPISEGKLAALGVSRETMLERIREAVSLPQRRGFAWRSSASTRRGPTSSSSASRTRAPSTPAPRRSSSSTRSESRHRKRLPSSSAR